MKRWLQLSQTTSIPDGESMSELSAMKRLSEYLIEKILCVDVHAQQRYLIRGMASLVLVDRLHG